MKCRYQLGIFECTAAIKWEGEYAAGEKFYSCELHSKAFMLDPKVSRMRVIPEITTNHTETKVVRALDDGAPKD